MARRPTERELYEIIMIEGSGLKGKIWGFFDADGQVVALLRGPWNRCSFVNARGERIGKCQPNVAPAIAAAAAANWRPLEKNIVRTLPPLDL